jgi:cold shock protein
MTTISSKSAAQVKLQMVTVARLEPDAGFGYVRDKAGEHSYIFVVGKALKHAQARKLTIGKAVKFRVSGQGRVEELVIA